MIGHHGFIRKHISGEKQDQKQRGPGDQCCSFKDMFLFESFYQFMDDNRKNEHDDAGLEKKGQLHLCSPKAFYKHKLVKDHNTGQNAFDGRIHKVEPKYFFLICAQINTIQFLTPVCFPLLDATLLKPCFKR